MRINKWLLSIVFSIFSITFAFSQTDTTVVDNKLYVVIKQDGNQFVGRILKQDSREVLIETKEMGQIAIPKHVIKQIRELQPGELNQRGEFIPSELFASRYFITTNGFPIEKGDSYILYKLIGPEFQFGIKKNLGIGLITSWVGAPIIGSLKYTISEGTGTSIGVGLLAGWGTWAQSDAFFGLPYGTVTFGDHSANVSFSAGFGGLTFTDESFDYYGNSTKERISEGRFMCSAAAMFKVGKKVSLVFDSFISPKGSGEAPGFTLVVPGLRFQTDKDKAFQFGFASMIAEGEFVPMPIPFVQWFRRL